jgi:hypothetical protein
MASGIALVGENMGFADDRGERPQKFGMHP